VPLLWLTTIHKGNYMKIVIMENGPILVDGPAIYKDLDSGKDVNLLGSKIALCRCGNSKSKPFCDSSHSTCDFNAPQFEIIAG